MISLPGFFGGFATALPRVQLEETVRKFEDFLKENDMKAVEAMKKAEHESAAGPPDPSGRQSANVNAGFASVKLTNFYKKN